MPYENDSYSTRVASPARTSPESAEHEGATAPYQALKNAVHPNVASKMAQTKTGSADGNHPNLHHYMPVGASNHHSEM